MTPFFTPINIKNRQIMENIEILSLIDITQTNVIRPNQGSLLELDQQRNFITLLQCAEIRSVIMYDSPPSCQNIDIKNLGFGSEYRGKHNVWTFKFETDRSGVYHDSNGDPIGILINDVHSVPIVKKLKETINIDRAIFECRDTRLKNIIIKLL